MPNYTGPVERVQSRIPVDTFNYIFRNVGLADRGLQQDVIEFLLVKFAAYLATKNPIPNSNSPQYVRNLAYLCTIGDPK